MLIKGISLKEKSIVLLENRPSIKMKINMSRTNLMPQSASKIFQCAMELNVSIEDDEKKNPLVEMKLAYFIGVAMEDDELYDQKITSGNIYDKMQAVFIKEFNDMLMETVFPPLPYNIKC